MTSSDQATQTLDMRTAKTNRMGGGKKARVERGFAAMDPKRQREIASEGGKAAHLSGNAHQFTSEEARAAGRKGGKASGRGKTAAGHGGEAAAKQ